MAETPDIESVRSCATMLNLAKARRRQTPVLHRQWLPRFSTQRAWRREESPPTPAYVKELLKSA